MSNTRDGLPFYICDYCRKDISKGMRMKCAECTDFDLCVECFSVGVEVTPHKNDHPYFILDRVNFPLYTPDWEADEELLLLEAIQKYGLGNWEDVGEYVGSKNEYQCEEHYFSIYINVPSFPVPSSDNLLTTPETLSKRKRESDERRSKEHHRHHQQHKKAKTGAGSSSSGAGSSKTLPGIGGSAADDGGDQQGNNNKKQQKVKEYASVPVRAEMAGYMPFRQEFDVEYHHDAESIIAPLVFEGNRPEEDPDSALKLRLLELYNQKLMERYRRREFVISRQLMNVSAAYNRDRRMWPDDRELYYQLRPFMQVLSRDDYNTFVDGLIAERQIRRRIRQLQGWRDHGLRTLAEGDAYEESKRQRRDLLNRAAGAAAAAGSAAAAGAPGALQQQQHQQQQYQQQLVMHTQQAAQVAQQAQPPSQFDRFLTKVVPRARRQGAPALDPHTVALLPGAELMSELERQMCARLRLYPAQYLLVKDALIRENAKTGYLKKSALRQFVKLDPSKAAMLFDFAQQQGWINYRGKFVVHK